MLRQQQLDQNANGGAFAGAAVGGGRAAAAAMGGQKGRLRPGSAHMAVASSYGARSSSAKQRARPHSAVAASPSRAHYR